MKSASSSFPLLVRDFDDGPGQEAQNLMFFATRRPLLELIHLFII